MLRDAHRQLKSFLPSSPLKVTSGSEDRRLTCSELREVSQSPALPRLLIPMPDRWAAPPGCWGRQATLYESCTGVGARPPKRPHTRRPQAPGEALPDGRRRHRQQGQGSSGQGSSGQGGSSPAMHEGETLLRLPLSPSLPLFLLLLNHGSSTLPGICFPLVPRGFSPRGSGALRFLPGRGSLPPRQQRRTPGAAPPRPVWSATLRRRLRTTAARGQPMGPAPPPASPPAKQSAAELGKVMESRLWDGSGLCLSPRASIVSCLDSVAHRTLAGGACGRAKVLGCRSGSRCGLWKS